MSDPARASAADAFLAPVGPAERSPWRIAAVLGGGMVLAFVLAAAALLLGALLLMAGEKVGFYDAVRSLSTTDEGRPLLSYMPAYAMVGLSLGLPAFAIVRIAAWLYRRPMRSFLTAAPRFRWRAAAYGLAIAAPLTLAAILAEAAWLSTDLAPPVLQPDETLPARVGFALGAVAFLYVAALGEEVIFRGWMLQQVAAFTRRAAVVLVVTGVAFSAVHADPNPAAFVVRTLMGMGFAWTVLRTGGLEFASGAHLANNLMIALFATPAILKVPGSEAYDLRGFVAQGAVIVLVVLFVEWVMRRPALARRLGLTI